MKISSQHVSFEKLADLVEGRVSAPERAASLAHMDACSDCSAQFARLEHVLGLMRRDTTEDAPSYLVARAVDLYEPRAASTANGATKTSAVRRVLAALSFDSMQLTPAYGVRSGQAATRQLLYSAGGSDLDLRLMPKDEKWAIAGQVLGHCAGGQVELQNAAGDETAAMLNDLCEFTLPPVPAGNYRLRLRFNDMEIEIPELQLRA